MATIRTETLDGYTPGARIIDVAHSNGNIRAHIEMVDWQDMLYIHDTQASHIYPRETQQCIWTWQRKGYARKRCTQPALTVRGVDVGETQQAAVICRRHHKVAQKGGLMIAA